MITKMRSDKHLYSDFKGNTFVNVLINAKVKGQFDCVRALSLTKGEYFKINITMWA